MLVGRRRGVRRATQLATIAAPHWLSGWRAYARAQIMASYCGPRAAGGSTPRCGGGQSHLISRMPRYALRRRVSRHDYTHSVTVKEGGGRALAHVPLVSKILLVCSCGDPRRAPLLCNGAIRCSLARGFAGWCGDGCCGSCSMSVGLAWPGWGCCRGVRVGVGCAACARKRLPLEWHLHLAP